MEIIQKAMAIENREVHFYEKENINYKEIDAIFMNNIPAVGNYFILEKLQQLVLVKDIIRDSSSVFIIVEKSSKYDTLIKTLYRDN